VDDGSSDGTLAVLRAAAATDPSVRFVSFTRNFGQQAALRAGLRHARGRVVVLMDADFEHPPELIPKLVAAWRAGAKVVTTQRSDDEAALSPMKRISSRLFYRLLDMIGDARIAPGSSDFMLLDRAVVDIVNSSEDESMFLRGFVRWLGFPIIEMPFSRGQRRQGSTKYTLRRMVELAVSGIAAHSVRPLRFAIWLSLGFAAVGLLLVVYSVISFLFVQRTVAGWTSIMAAIALLGASRSSCSASSANMWVASCGKPASARVTSWQKPKPTSGPASNTWPPQSRAGVLEGRRSYDVGSREAGVFTEQRIGDLAHLLPDGSIASILNRFGYWIP